jgi:hypothetical protein
MEESDTYKKVFYAKVSEFRFTDFNLLVNHYYLNHSILENCDNNGNSCNQLTQKLLADKTFPALFFLLFVCLVPLRLRRSA